MSLDGRAMGDHLRVSGLAMLAGWVTLLSWQALTEDYSLVSIPLFLIGLVVLLIGALGRGLRWAWSVTLPAQVVASGMLLLGAVTGSILPTIGNLDELRRALLVAIETAQRFVAPAPAGDAPVHPLLLIGGVMILLIIEMYAGTMRRVPLAGVALLTAYVLPTAVTSRPVPVLIFLVGGALFVAALFAEHRIHVNRWSREGDGSGNLSVRAGTTVARSGVVMGACALALGATVPLVVPTLDAAVFKGAGSGSGSVSVHDPMVDLRRDLQRGDDIPLMTVSTTGPAPSYLRLSVLTTFVNDRWTPGDREIPESQTATGEMPALEGVSTALARTTSRTRVRISSDLDATWLPTLPQISRISAGTDWRYDRDTRDFIGVRDGVSTAGRSYEFTAVNLDYEAARMDDATSGVADVDSVFTNLPNDMDGDIRKLATSLTANAETKFQKVQVLQQWFREDGGFRYDLAAVDSVGEGGADLSAFLAPTGRVGYCEQFAAAMAIMARTLGVPSRVAVGFLEPERVDRDQYVFSAWDLHAWPELYFPGSGWVRFEPTPAARAERAPSYSTAEIGTVTETASPSALPSSTADGQVQPEGVQLPDEPVATGQDSDSFVSRLVVTVAVGGVVLLLLVLALLSPRWRRHALRSRRRRGGVEEVWDELRDLTIDLGHTWPSGRSPRHTGRLLGEMVARPTTPRKRPERPRCGRDQAPEAAQALDRIVRVMERSRYASTGNEATDIEALQRDADLVGEALVSGVSAKEERRAQWWPRSVVAGRSWRGGGRRGGALTRERSRTDDEVVASTTEELVG